MVTLYEIGVAPNRALHMSMSQSFSPFVVQSATDELAMSRSTSHVVSSPCLQLTGSIKRINLVKQ